jgi:hypothetical protein
MEPWRLTCGLVAVSELAIMRESRGTPVDIGVFPEVIPQSSASRGMNVIGSVLW